MKHSELDGYAFEDLKVGMRATVSRTITETALDATKNRVTLTMQCIVKDKVVIDGEALIKVASRAQ